MSGWQPIEAWDKEVGPYTCLVRLRIATNPKTGEHMKITCLGYYVWPGRWTANATDDAGDRVTHWMPLPPPPEVEE